jgi:hypothetical protein
MAVLQDAFGHTSRGLDRGSMRNYTPVDGRAQPGNGCPVDTGTDTSVVTDNRSRSSGNVTKRLSGRLRSKFHLKKQALLPSSDQETRRPELTIVAPTLAPAPPDTSEKDRFSKVLPNKPSLPPLKDFITSPLQTAQTIAEVQGGDDFAQNLTIAAATHEASVKFVRAYEKIAVTVTDADEDLARKDLELLKKARQDGFVRWTLDRHVHKVGRLKARAGSMRPRKDFMAIDQHGRKVMQWEEYGDHVRVLAFGTRSTESSGRQLRLLTCS